jgi:hypothetical protein
MAAFIFLDSAMETDPLTLTIVTAFFLVGIFALGGVARRMGVPAHDARVAAMAMFLVLSVTDWWNAVLPTVFLFAHVLVNRSHDRWGGLDVIGAIAILGFTFLAAGNMTSLRATAFFGLACAGGAVAHFAHAGRQAPLVHRLAFSLVAAGVLWAIWTWAQHLNGPSVAWPPYLFFQAPILLVAIALLTTLRPSLALTARRAALVGCLPAVALYLLSLATHMVL